jgi:hypothetical protein
MISKRLFGRHTTGCGSVLHEANRFYPGCLPEAKSSMPIPEVQPQAIASRLPFLQARFLPQYAGDLDDGTVRELLNELAAEMARTLEQEEVHIAYGDRTWTLKAE